MPTKLGTTALLALIAFTIGFPTASAINKCPGPDGRVMYQERPCDGGQRVDTSAAGRPAPADVARQKDALSTELFRAQVRRAILVGEPLIGMTQTELAQAMGRPDRENLGNYEGNTRHQLIFDRGDRTFYVYTRNGVVSSIQSTARLNMPATQANAGPPCPGPQSFRNLETSASSTTIPYDERVERRRQLDEVRRRCGY